MTEVKDVSIGSRHFNADTTSLYLNEIGAYELLTKEDEARLSQAIEAGVHAQTLLDTQFDTLSRTEKRKARALASQGADAKQEFLHANLRLVVSIANRYQNIKGMEQLDLIQEGYFGLDRAVDKFDWRKGFKFSTYATWWISQSILRAAAKSGRVIKIPVREQKLIKQVDMAIAELKSGQIEPTTAAIAEYLEWPEEHVIATLQDDEMTKMLSLNEPLNSDSDAEYDEVIGDPKSTQDYAKVEEQLTNVPVIEEMQRILTHAECEVVFSRFGIDDGTPKTWSEVADHKGLTVHKAKRLQMKAFEKLREHDIGLLVQ